MCVFASLSSSIQIRSLVDSSNQNALDTVKPRVLQPSVCHGNTFDNFTELSKTKSEYRMSRGSCFSSFSHFKLLPTEFSSVSLLPLVLQQSLGVRSGLDGLDKVLRCLAVYRKQDAVGGEEDEYVHNLGHCIAAFLQEPQNRTIFGQIQGIELMIRLMRDRMKTFPLALRLTMYALQNNKDNCRLFVDK